MVLNYKNNNLLKTAIHLLVWIVFFGLPYFIFPRQENDFGKLINRNLFPLIEYALIFYLNYFILLKKFLFQKKYVSYFLFNIGLIAFLLWFNWQFRDLFMKVEMPGMMFNPNMGGKPAELFNRKSMFPPPNNFFIFKDLFSFIIPVIFSTAVKATENWIKTEAEKKEIENKNLASELQHLKYQLQPHFFFNSLNNIYSLIEVSPNKAQEAVHGLSKLMRYLLYDTSREKVDLSLEIDFLKKYIQLMELRQTNKTIMGCSFPELGNKSYYVAPLLFIPIIENAYKHGISATQKSHLSFEMKIKDNRLFFLSENSNFPKNDTDKSGSGIGLDNLKKRLELLYPNKYVLKNGLRENVYWVMLSIEMD